MKAMYGAMAKATLVLFYVYLSMAIPQLNLIETMNLELFITQIGRSWHEAS